MARSNKNRAFMVIKSRSIASLALVGASMCLAAGWGQTAGAAGIVLGTGTTSSPVFHVPAIDSVTNGADMIGATVTLHYDTGIPDPVPSETVSLAALSTTGARAVSGFGLWELLIDGPIHANPFELVATGMTREGIDRIEINLLPGNAVWDLTRPAPPADTPGSFGGQTFVPALGSPNFTGGSGGDFSGSWDVAVKYLDPVAVPSTGPAGAGDVFGRIEIDFLNNSPVGVFDANDFMMFKADTDRIKVVPEPSSLAIAALALAGLGLAATRRGTWRA